MTKEYKVFFLAALKESIASCEQAQKATSTDKKSDDAINYMLNDFRRLYTIIKNDKELVQEDYIGLYASAKLCRSIINRQFEALSSALETYDNSLIPNLQKVCSCETPESFAETAKNLFN